MSLQGVTEDEYIVKENGSESTEKRLKQGVHGSLECRRSITETEWHDAVLVMALVSSKSCFRNVRRGHANLVEALL